jgi:hypothetical protein
MTQIIETPCSESTKVNARIPRPAAPSRSRRHGIQLAYDGVAAAYIRDIAGPPGPPPRRRVVAAAD